MAYYKIDTKKFARLRKEAQQFQDDIVCAVGTDFMKNIAEAENRMIFDILNGIESEITADVVEVKQIEIIRDDLKWWLETNTQKGVVYIPKYVIENMIAKMDGELRTIKKINKNKAIDALCERE